ncbi:MAG: tRNA (N(6)-L-threonylcarbamoyladenosine(37)-C(2))-methylthiotransferase MtaB [Bacteroidales bacterium]
MIKKRIAFHTLGCKLNYSETSFLSQNIDKEKFTEVPFGSEADIYVINTCTVTATAEKKCRQIASKIKNRNPEAKVIFMGCYSELKHLELENFDGVDVIIGGPNKPQLLDVLNDDSYFDTKSSLIDPNSREEFFSTWSSGERTRSFLKIQDGCDYHCSYCAVALARGDSRSDSIENVVKNVKTIAKEGIKEIILTGVNIGDFGRKNGESFYELLVELDKVEEMDRIRISSIEPNLLTDEIIELVSKSKRIMPHFHIPLQSAKSEILKMMKRRYNVELFTNRIKTIKELIPHACIAIDLICGFPGETDDFFEESFDYLNELPISYLHVFTYSLRPDTPAEMMKNHVPERSKKERSSRLHKLSDKKKLAFYKQFIGKEMDVLFESTNSKGFIEGFTGNYIRVKTEFDPELINNIVKVNLKEIDKDGNVLGEV